MAYTDELKQLIKRVEKTRPQRLAKKREGWEFPRMSLVSHVGVYAGEGKFIHAPGVGKRIRTDLLGDRYYAARYLGARSYIR